MAALSAANPLEESPMRPSWKLALIGGEFTVLAAFTGIGIHQETIAIRHSLGIRRTVTLEERIQRDGVGRPVRSRQFGSTGRDDTRRNTPAKSGLSPSAQRRKRRFGH